ncbi:MAG: hypothetical protein ACYCYO_05715 [Bacilli bacterium]
MNRSFLPKGAVYKEWRQMRLIVFAYVFAAILLPILGSLIEEFITLTNGYYQGDNIGFWAHAVIRFQGGNPLTALPFLVAAAWGLHAVYVERNGFNLEAALSGPLRRRDLIATKWAMAALVILGANLPGAILLFVEACGLFPAMTNLMAAAQWYFVNAGLQWLAFALAFVVALGVGRYSIAVAFIGFFFCLPSLLLAALGTMIESGATAVVYNFYHQSYLGVSSYWLQIIGHIDSWAKALFSFTYLNLNGNYRLGYEWGRLDAVFPVALCIVIGLYWLAQHMTNRLALEYFRNLFVFRPFAFIMWATLIAFPAWLVGMLGMSYALSRTNLLYQTTHQWHVISPWPYFIGGFILTALILLGLRYLLLHRWRRFFHSESVSEG